MDDLADRLGIDRLELRRLNASKPGDVSPQGFVLTSFAMRECLDAAAEEIAKDPPPPVPGCKRGVGYAAMFHVGGGARIYRSDGCGAIVKLDDFGKVSLITGATEIGQGSETVLSMIVAETLGVPIDRVEVVNSDTTIKPWDVGVHATRAIRVRRIVSAHDVGRALNPAAAEGQIHGGIHMGLGYALSEKLVVTDGQILTASFMDYALFRADDMPEMVVKLVESIDEEG